MSGRFARLLAVLVLLGAGCGDEGASAPEPSTSTTSTSTSTSTTSTSTTEAPAPVCEAADVYAVVDDALSSARLAAGGVWQIDVSASGFVDRTTPAAEFAAELALDCGVLAAQHDAAGDRLLLAAWTGPRMAFVVQADDLSDPPLEPESIVTIVTEEPIGEYLVDDNSAWAGRLASGATLVAGHVDYNLGVALKTWQADVPRLPDAEPTLDAERYGIDALEASGARKPAVAAEATFGSEEGFVMFVSPTGQIIVASVAPAGWYDPMVPRYLDGATTMRQISGVDVRITEPGTVTGSIGTEIGWACGDWVWVIEPPLNGTGAEMIPVVEALITTGDC